MCTSVCVCAHARECGHKCVHACVYVLTSVCAAVCTCMCMCVCVHRSLPCVRACAWGSVHERGWGRVSVAAGVRCLGFCAGLSSPAAGRAGGRKRARNKRSPPVTSVSSLQEAINLTLLVKTTLQQPRALDPPAPAVACGQGSAREARPPPSSPLPPPLLRPATGGPVLACGLLPLPSALPDLGWAWTEGGASAPDTAL